MFSYRHAFHAGNHADVLKHAVLLQILEYFQRKPTPYWIIDTHAGAGVYDLQGDWAQQSAEYQEGIERLWNCPTALPELLERYRQVLCDCQQQQLYPGSPWLSLSQLRDKDRLRLFEWHPNEYQQLKQFIDLQERSLKRQTQVFHADGFQGIKALLPPPTKRGVVLIDPSYENKKDYSSVVQCLKAGLQRFATGCYVVWYPLVKRVQCQEMLRHLKHVQQPWLNVSYQVKAPQGLGLYGSGLFIVHPPYTLEAQLQQAMPTLLELLAQDSQTQFTIETSA